MKQQKPGVQLCFMFSSHLVGLLEPVDHILRKSLRGLSRLAQENLISLIFFSQAVAPHRHCLLNSSAFKTSGNLILLGYHPAQEPLNARIALQPGQILFAPRQDHQADGAGFCQLVKVSRE